MRTCDRGRESGSGPDVRTRGVVDARDMPQFDHMAVLFDLDGVLTRRRAIAATVDGVTTRPGAVRWLEHLRAAGVRTAVVSSNPNVDDMLDAAGIAGLFELSVDGRDVVRLGLHGKPAPDAFLEAASRLGVPPSRAVVVEDALAGVAAGRAGGFAQVIGVARTAAEADLRSAGADVVVRDLGELVP